MKPDKLKEVMRASIEHKEREGEGWHERDEFSVYEFFADGTHNAIVRFVSAKNAVAIAKLAVGFGTKHGAVRKVIITDGGDCISFEWIYGKGITFPTPEDLK